MRNQPTKNEDFSDFLLSLPRKKVNIGSNDNPCSSDRQYYRTTPEALKDLRIGSGLTQAQAANLCFSTLRQYRDFEAGNVEMHPAIYKTLLDELALLKGWPDRQIVSFRQGCVTGNGGGQ